MGKLQDMSCPAGWDASRGASPDLDLLDKRGYENRGPYDLIHGALRDKGLTTPLARGRSGMGVVHAQKSGVSDGRDICFLFWVQP